jgi:hypothetical protein
MAHNTQNNNHNIDGRVIHISQPKYISATFSKQTLVMEIFTGERRNEVPFTFSNARMDALKDIKEGDWVNVQFQLSGQRAKGDGEPRWFNENIGQTCIKS